MVWCHCDVCCVLVVMKKNRWLQHVWIIIKVTKLLAKECAKAYKLTHVNNKLDILETLCFELE